MYDEVLNDIDNAIELQSIKDIQEKNSLSDFSLLVLVNREERDNLFLIRDIRFSTRENLDSPGMPIILLTTSTLSDLAPDKAAYLHLRDHGTALSIPFTLESLNECLKRAVYFDSKLLKDVKGSFRWRAWVYEILHNMKENNYKEKIEFLVDKVVPDEYKEQIAHLKSMGYLSARQKLEEIIREHV